MTCKYYMIESRFINNAECTEIRHYFPEYVDKKRDECWDRFHKMAAKLGFEIWVPGREENTGHYRRPDSKDTLRFRP